MVLENDKVLKDVGFGRSQYYNLWGIWESPDEGALRQEEYENAVKKYAIPKTCANLDSTIKSLDNEIKSAEQERANQTAIGGSGRPQNRKIDGYTKRRDELVAMANEWLCEENKAKLENQEFLDSTLQQLEAAKSLTEKGDKTTTYIIWGMLGLVVVVSGLLIFKK